jgi:hypothetical protein
MTAMKRTSTPPVVQLFGEITHPDFEEAIGLLRSQAQVIVFERGTLADNPELIVVAQSRPGVHSALQVETLRRAAPLAGIVGLLGSWCEGETRTGRPWPGVQRLYWYEFPGWWRRQFALHAAGRCPDWARPDAASLASRNFNAFVGARTRGELIVIQSNVRETASALADVFGRAGFATACQRSGKATMSIRGATAGIWDGGQLHDREASELSSFCGRLNVDRAPVIAILDFPRRDAVERAMQCGAEVVIGKPWINRELVEAVATLARRASLTRAA